MILCAHLSCALFLAIGTWNTTAPGEESNDARRFKVLQEKLWKANEKKVVLDEMLAFLDDYCKRTIEGGAGVETIQKTLNEFYAYSGRTPVVRAMALGRFSWVISLNISTYGGGDYESILLLLVRKDDKTWSKATLRMTSQEQLRDYPLPFQELTAVPDSTAADSIYSLLISSTRTTEAFVLVNVNQNAVRLNVIMVRVRQREADDPGRVAIDGKAVVVTFPKPSRGIAEQGGKAMLLMEERLAINAGKVEKKSERVVNEWYRAVIKAIAFQKEGNREAFDDVCGDKRFWDILANSAGVTCESQQVEGDGKAVVVLDIEYEDAGKRSVLTLDVRNKDGKWIVTAVREAKQTKKGD